MDKNNSNFPLSLKASFVFMFIALAIFLIMLGSINSASDGLGGAGQGWAAVVVIMIVGIPSCLLSLVTGLVGLSHTKLAYLTVVPTGLTTLFVVWQYLALSR